MCLCLPYEWPRDSAVLRGSALGTAYISQRPTSPTFGAETACSIHQYTHGAEHKSRCFVGYHHHSFSTPPRLASTAYTFAIDTYATDPASFPSIEITMSLFSFISPRRLKEFPADNKKEPAPTQRSRTDSVQTQTPRTQSHTTTTASHRRPSHCCHHETAKRIEAVTKTKIAEVKRKLSRHNILHPNAKATQTTNAPFRLQPQTLPEPLVTKDAPRSSLHKKPTIPRLHEGQVKSSAEILDPFGMERPYTPPPLEADPSSVPQAPEHDIHPAFRTSQAPPSTTSVPLRTSLSRDEIPYRTRTSSSLTRTASPPPPPLWPLLPTPPRTPETPMPPPPPQTLKRGISERPPASPSSSAPSRLKTLRRSVSQKLPRLHAPLRVKPDDQRSFVGISIQYNTGSQLDASSTVPALRYEAMRRDTEPPMLM